MLNATKSPANFLAGLYKRMYNKVAYFINIYPLIRRGGLS